MELTAPLEEYLEARALKISLRLGRKDRKCPRCSSQFVLAVDIIEAPLRVAKVKVRFLIYCKSCGWWIAMLEQLNQSDNRMGPAGTNQTI